LTTISLLIYRVIPLEGVNNVIVCALVK